MKTHTSSFKEQIKLIGKEIDSRITFGSTVLGKNDLNAVTPSYQGAILKSVMKQLDIDSNVEIPIGTILKYEFGLKVNGEYEYINYGNYVVYSIEKQEDTNSYKITCYDKLLYSMLDYVKLPITYPISIRDYINAISTALGLKFANKSGTFANYDKQIQADLYDGLGYTFRDILDELAQVTASTICLNNNDELEIRYISETGDTIDEEFLKDVNVNFGEKFGAVNTIVLSRSGDSDSVYYPSTLPTNPYEIKISDNQIMNGNDRADFLPDIYNKLNGLEFYTNDFVSTGICYYDLCDRYSVKVGDTTYSCVMFNDEILVTQGLEENIYTELPEQTETDYKHASKDDRMINQVYLIVKKNEAEILAVINTTEQLQKEINPTKNESDSKIIIEDASNNPLTYLEIEGKSTQEVRSGKNLFNINDTTPNTLSQTDGVTLTTNNSMSLSNYIRIEPNETYKAQCTIQDFIYRAFFYDESKNYIGTNTFRDTMSYNAYYVRLQMNKDFANANFQLEKGSTATEYEQYGASPSPDFPSEIESVGYENLWQSPESESKDGIEFTKNEDETHNITGTATAQTDNLIYIEITDTKLVNGEIYTFGVNQPLPSGVEILCEAYNGTTWVRHLFGGYLFSDRLTRTNAIDLTDITRIRFVLRILNGTKINISNLGVMIEKGSAAHPYIPYGKSGIEVKTTNGTDTNTSVIVLNAPLRSLPNGVRDIAYIKNNKLYVDRYVGSVVLDGSEDWIVETAYDGYARFKINVFFKETIIKNTGMNNYFKQRISEAHGGYEYLFIQPNSKSIYIQITPSRLNENSVIGFKTWLSTHNVQVDYELATPVTEELGEIEMLKTLKDYNNITTTDKLLPIINLTYVRDTVIADYVENHVTELKLTENEIKASVESVSSSVDGLNTTINRVEEITNDNSQVINVISTNIDRTSGEVREVTTTTGFTFNADGMTIDDGSGFKAQHRSNGTYYKDGESIVGQYTKDGSKQKDLELFGTYSYGKETIDDTPMFIGQLYTNENGEQAFGHFYNGEG